MINDMMKATLKDAGLTKKYTNHQVWATTINVLVTGHKCDRRLNSYHSNSCNEQKRNNPAISQGKSNTITT